MKKIIYIFLVISVILPFLLQGEYHFKGTDHELEVIRIEGKEPGLTMLIFGGIHGDEPGAHFSSEILSRINVRKGSLIIVPRVNFPGIMTNRRELFGDMNRKFIDKDYPKDPDAKVIRLLKKLMSESDIFVNQHDAYGFHRKTYISKTYNPFRYGQSLIVDTGRFYSKKLKKEIDLATLGSRVVERVNEQIESPKHHFCLWNHNSVARGTKFIDMQKSATYYALVKYSIPAFGLETSKDLPTLTHKVQYQLLVLKELLREFGFSFDFPSTRVKHPRLFWVECIKNDNQVIRVNNRTNIRLDVGDRLTVRGVYANYDGGLSADIKGWGTLNDLNKPFVFKKPGQIVIKKNNFTIGSLNLRKYRPKSLRNINVEVNGKPHTIPNWGKIEVARGQYFKISDTVPRLAAPKIDVRGFSLPPGKNDDSGVDIYPRDLLPKYSFRKEGNIYFVKIYKSGILAGGFQVEVVHAGAPPAQTSPKEIP